MFVAVTNWSTVLIPRSHRHQESSLIPKFVRFKNLPGIRGISCLINGITEETTPKLWFPPYCEAFLWSILSLSILSLCDRSKMSIVPNNFILFSRLARSLTFAICAWYCQDSTLTLPDTTIRILSAASLLTPTMWEPALKTRDRMHKSSCTTINQYHTAQLCDLLKNQPFCPWFTQCLLT